jgi:hypothetical protein
MIIQFSFRLIQLNDLHHNVIAPEFDSRIFCKLKFYEQLSLYDEGPDFPRNVELENWVYGNHQFTKLFMSRLITRMVNDAQ